MSPIMDAAIVEFVKIRPPGCTVYPCSDKPIYTLVKIEGFPQVLHYEFRYSRNEGLFVEFHIEKKEYAYIGKTLSILAGNLKTIAGRRILYYDSRPYPNFKKWPSLSIHVNPDSVNIGKDAANIMREFILATRGAIQVAKGV